MQICSKFPTMVHICTLKLEAKTIFTFMIMLWKQGFLWVFLPILISFILFIKLMQDWKICTFNLATFILNGPAIIQNAISVGELHCFTRPKNSMFDEYRLSRRNYCLHMYLWRTLRTFPNKPLFQNVYALSFTLCTCTKGCWRKKISAGI